MTTSVEELERWMRVPAESENLEFKAAKSGGIHSDRIFKYSVAISNEGGGRLILGVSNDLPRKVVGTQAAIDPPGMQKKILDTLHFLVRVEELQHPDGRVVIFHIPSRDRGTARQYEGAYWMRSGEELKPMTPERLKEIFAENRLDWLEEYSLTGLSGAEVVDVLDTQTYFELLGMGYPSEREGVIDRLLRERLIDEDDRGLNIRRLGAVLLAKRLADFPELSRKAPRVVVYIGGSKIKTRLDTPGTMGYAVGFQGLVRFVMSQLPQK
jgi:predicted HTH transcriptional regulator